MHVAINNSNLVAQWIIPIGGLTASIEVWEPGQATGMTIKDVDALIEFLTLVRKQFVRGQESINKSKTTV